MIRSVRRRMCAALLLAGSLFGGAPAAAADEVVVAVASNFAAAARALATRFESTTDHEVTLVTGSTGKLYAQIVRGAPFDVFLAADAVRPARLVDEGRALADSRRVYALGRLVLWSRSPARFERLGPEALARGGFRHLALANPDLAPYGRAARETLRALDLETGLAGRLVFGENVGQTFALVASGNAELGFVAASQLVARDDVGSGWLVPRDLHAPIRQEGVLLARSAGNAAARSFFDALVSREGKRTIEAAGYEVP
ncbi:MAG: molybdate ABC transporter substrate-binding protein [Myxococcota bacterium]